QQRSEHNHDATKQTGQHVVAPPGVALTPSRATAKGAPQPTGRHCPVTTSNLESPPGAPFRADTAHEHSAAAHCLPRPTRSERSSSEPDQRQSSRRCEVQAIVVYQGPHHRRMANLQVSRYVVFRNGEADPRQGVSQGAKTLSVAEAPS